MYTLCLSLLGASLWTISAAQNVISLAPALQPTPGSSAIISPSFAGFGIEPSNLYSFTGGAYTNELTMNLLSNLANYTGTPPHIRLGGNTQDTMIYKESQNDYVVEENPNSVGQGAFATDEFIIGPRFLEVLNRFPSNTPITYGLSLAYSESDYIDQLTTWATAVVTKLTNLNLVSFEIGNEPDLYSLNGFRSGPWDGQVYTESWLDRAKAIWEQVLKPNGIGSNFFEPGCTASTIGTSFAIENLIEFDITEHATGSTHPYISSWNQHDYYYYIGVSTYALTMDSFMSLPSTIVQFSGWVSQVNEALDTPYPYALREMGVVGPIGYEGITDVFAAALWTLNFFCYAATLNISSVQMHMTDNSNASAWQPIAYYGKQPFVRPNYYAWAAFDQTIGGTCQAQISGYVIQNPPAEYDGRIAAYSVYQSGTLASMILINTKVANESDSKGSLTVDLSLPTQFAGQPMYLSYLTADGADSKHGTTWNGLSYEQNSNGSPTLVNSTQNRVIVRGDGGVSVTVRDTQAVIANIGYPVGSATSNPSACLALASKTPDARPVATPVGTDPNRGDHTSAASANGMLPKSSSILGIFGLNGMMFLLLFASFVSGIVLMI